MRQKPRILAVDDEPRGVELVRRILRGVARVETATSGAAAWELLLAGEFDLVISDQRMPGMSGVELLARVADRFAYTGRILLTGYADAVDTVDAINLARVHAYLHKPCTPDHLRLSVDAVLDGVETLRENARLAGELRAREAASAPPARDPARTPLGPIARDLAGCAAAIRSEAREMAAPAAPGGEDVAARAQRIDAEGARIEDLCAQLVAAGPAGGD